ncbi:MAG: SPFH domain-containing protein [Candidatus Shapirobacteria bacterium]
MEFLTFPIIIIVVIFLVKFFRVIPEGYKGLVLFLGKYSRTIEPGLNIVFIPLETVSVVDIREQVMDIPTQEAITGDNVSCMVDGIVRFKVVDASVAMFKVQNFTNQISAKAQTALRDVIGSITLDEILSKRAQIAEHIKSIVDEAAGQWGVDILAIEIQNIEIPADMKRAMAQQAEAERDKKARIIKAEGERDAAVKLTEAAQILSGAKGALELRTLQTLKEISADPSEKIIMTLPNTFFEAFGGKK